MQSRISQRGISQTGTAGAGILRLQAGSLKENTALPYSLQYSQPSLKRPERCSQRGQEQIQIQSRAAGEQQEQPGSMASTQSPAWMVTLPLKCHILKMFGGKGCRTWDSLTSPRL